MASLVMERERSSLRLPIEERKERRRTDLKLALHLGLAQPLPVTEQNRPSIRSSAKQGKLCVCVWLAIGMPRGSS